MILPIRLDWRLEVIGWLDAAPEPFYWIGAACFGLGLFFVTAFFCIGRGRYLRLSMTPHSAVVEAKLIEQAIREVVKIQFPHQVSGVDVAVHSKERLEVAIDLEPLEERKREQMLAQAEGALKLLLRERFGYKRPFTLFVRSNR
jgi:hypothetical protein